VKALAKELEGYTQSGKKFPIQSEARRAPIPSPYMTRAYLTNAFLAQ
jgi:hypothetical protein